VNGLRLAAFGAALLVILPLLAVTVLALRPAEAGPGPDVLLRYARDTALLALGVATSGHQPGRTGGLADRDAPLPRARRL
jgi:hypothetical protein